MYFSVVYSLNINDRLDKCFSIQEWRIELFKVKGNDFLVELVFLREYLEKVVCN